MERKMSGGGENINRAYDSTGDLETSFSGNGNSQGVSNDDHRTVRASVVSAFGHDTLDRVPNIDFYPQRRECQRPQGRMADSQSSDGIPSLLSPSSCTVSRLLDSPTCGGHQGHGRDTW
ncbi:hypothetical protein CRUP_001516, partial [Coryphaenoides rupestris]